MHVCICLCGGGAALELLWEKEGGVGWGVGGWGSGRVRKLDLGFKEYHENDH